MHDSIICNAITLLHSKYSTIKTICQCLFALHDKIVSLECYVNVLFRRVSAGAEDSAELSFTIYMKGKIYMTAEAKAKRAAYLRAWRAANAEKVKKYQKQYRETHTDQIRAYHRDYNQKHPEKVKAYNERYWAKKASENSGQVQECV